MASISFNVQESASWLNNIADQLESKIVNDCLQLSAKYGKGFIKNICLTNGLTVCYMHTYFYEPLQVLRNSIDNVALSPIHFYLHQNQVVQQIDGRMEEIGISSSNGIFWPSSVIESRWEYACNTWIDTLVINVNHESLLSRMKLNEDSYVKTLLQSSHPFYVFEYITPEMNILLKEIVDVFNEYDQSLSSEFLLEGKISQLFGHFIARVNKRKQIGRALDFNEKDINRLFKVKEELLRDLSETPQVKFLAEKFAFSESKLQKLFKQVFGKSMYQFALYEKMLRAQTMLLSGKHSVTEVGYCLGYSNLSHFTKAYKNQFGLSPKSVCKND